MSELADAVNAVLHAAEERLRGSDIEAVARAPEHVVTLLAAGEDDVAYETLCENLHEDDVAVARGLLSSLRAAVRGAGADMALIETLLI